jgi:hypothetical protein
MLRKHSTVGAVTTAALILAGLSACSSGDESNFAPGGSPPPYSAVPGLKVSQPTSFPSGCDGVTQDGTLYNGTAIEPQVAVSPFSPGNLIATWQQNRWSTGGSQAIGIAASFDGGNTWGLSNEAFFSRCTGGSPSNAGNYARASNAWVTISPNGVAYVLALAFTGEPLATGSSSAMLVASSRDGGANWSLPIALIQDGATFYNDKGSITADPTDNNFVYAVWDRLSSQNTGPSYFSLTANANSTWSVPVNIYDPGTSNQTINNVIVVTPDGTLVDLFNEIDAAVSGSATSHLKAMQSNDHGTTWSKPPIAVADMLGVGTADPNNQNGVRDSVLLFTVALGPTGTIYVAWQDARFSDGQYDGIALSYSTDDGKTWSTPVQVNRDPSVPAFTPTLNVSAAGVIAVTYYDLRNAHYLTTALLTDAWIVTSSDAVTFTESHLSGPFDLQLAPLTTQGYFLGDYQALINNGTQFQPLYAQSNQGVGVSTDVFFWSPTTSAMAQAAAAPAMMFTAHPAFNGGQLSAAVRERISRRIRSALAHRPD